MNIRRSWMAGLLASGLAFAQQTEPVEAPRGVVYGTIQSLNFPAGILTVASGGKRIRLFGTPAQLGTYEPGEFATVEFASYGGSNWLTVEPVLLFGPSGGATGTTAGVVSGLDKAQGTLTLSEGDRTVELKAHPETLQSLVPGQLVSVTYTDVIDQSWIQSVK